MMTTEKKINFGHCLICLGLVCFWFFNFLPSVSAQTSKLRALPTLKDPASRGSVEEDDEGRKFISTGASIPMDDGRGYPNGYGYALWKRSGWPWPTTDFKLAFAVVTGDAELSLRGLITRDTDLGFGFSYRTLGRFEEYNRGQIDILSRMETHTVAGRWFVHHRIIHNYVEIAQARATYELGYADYARESETISSFTLAPSGIFQTVRLNAGTGKLKRSDYSPKGWAVNLEAEATFRDDWRRWGPPNAWDSPSSFQKFQMDAAYVASSVYDQKLLAKFGGGVGSGLDRLSTFRLGDSLSGRPDNLVLHGFYTHEIFAEDYVLLNLDYIIPLLREQELAFHAYADGAVTTRSDIPDHSAHVWTGIGAGVSFKGWWETQWVVGYGYGINAQRGNDHGGHEFFTQMSKQF